MVAHISRRTLLGGAAALAGATAAGAALAGCSSSTSSSGSGTLTYWDWWVSQASWVDNEIKLFHQAHPDLTVRKTTQVTDRYADLAALAFRSGNPPDVLLIPQTPPTTDQVGQGWFKPLDTWATSAWRSKFPPDSFVEGVNMFGGKIYSAPFTAPGPSLQLYVHNGVFKAAGLAGADGAAALPKTWDDVSRAAAAIKAKFGTSVYPLAFGNSSNSILQWWVDMFARAAGAPGGSGDMDYRVGRYTFASDRSYADFIGLMMQWRDKGYFYPSSMSISDEQARALFARGQVAMTVGGVWNQSGWSTQNFTDYSLMTLPSPTGTPAAYWYSDPGGSLAAITASAKNTDAAWAWFDWLYTPAAGRRWVGQGQGLSVFPQNNDASAVTFKPFAQYVAMAPTALIRPKASIRNPDTAQVAFETVKPDINDVLAGIYTKQIKNIGAALADLEHRQNKEVDDAIAAAKQKGLKVDRSDYVFPDWDVTKSYTTKPA
jgi:ABC-type glycerol-3-phosphate transport system substrate-binding protein